MMNHDFSAFKTSVVIGIRCISILIIAMVGISCNHIDDSPATSISAINETDKAEELRQVVMKIWEDAESSNIPELTSAHLNSPKFSKFGPRIAERQDLTQTINSETEHFSLIRNTDLIIEDLKIDIFDNVAIATFYNNYSFVKNDINIKGKGRVTLVFLRTGEGWKIIHEHSSPFSK